jgi:hypothetical protein
MVFAYEMFESRYATSSGTSVYPEEEINKPFWNLAPL